MIMSIGSNFKHDAIELKNINDTKKIHMTTEENRKILPRELKNLRYVLSKHSQITKYSWEVDGERVSSYL